MLKLVATDAEDMDVLSALMQDAVIPLSEMAYLPWEDRFALVAKRFCWEKTYTKSPEVNYQRIHCGLSFDRVLSVRRRKLDQAEQGRVLDFLAFDTTSDYIDLVFAGEATIRLEIDKILCHAEDFGEPWSTQWRPNHDPTEPAATDIGSSEQRREQNE